MDEDGGNVTQITFDNSRHLEHIALSFDRTKIIANYFSDPSVGGLSSKMLLYDITAKTVTQLLTDFEMAGNGGVDSDINGYIYFTGISSLPFRSPSTQQEFLANLAANDIYKMKFDGSGLQNLTNTTDRGEVDVSVSPNGEYVSYIATNLTDPNNNFTEIWRREVAGTNPKLIYVGGKPRVSSVHDPEISPDGNYIVCSRVNSNVPPVYPNDPNANTAHDIIKVNVNDATDVVVITQPGPISIVPDWRANKILFLEITDKTNPPHAGLATINVDGTGYQLINNGANIGKWIPD